MALEIYALSELANECAWRYLKSPCNLYEYGLKAGRRAAPRKTGVITIPGSPYSYKRQTPAVSGGWADHWPYRGLVCGGDSLNGRALGS